MIRNKVLFATDCSSSDQKSFRVACRLAEAWKSTLLVVHVEEPRRWKVDKTAESNSALELHRLFPENLSVDIERIVRRGDAATEILDVERNRNAILVVLGTKGRKGLERMFLGSVAEKIIRDASCPVLTIRDSTPQNLLSNRRPQILLPIDFSVYSYAAFQFATRLADSLEGELDVVHVEDAAEHSRSTNDPGRAQVIERGSKTLKRLREFKPKNARIKFNHHVMVGSPAEQILKYSKSKQFDFVILGTHGRSGIGRALLGSVAEKIVRNADCPVITIKPNDKRIPVFQYQ